MDIAPYKKPEYFRNRELSWVSFDERVLNEARDKSIPLFERLKFISITSSNLDEFYMVRVASLKDQVHANYTKKDLSGMDAKEQLAAVHEMRSDERRAQTEAAREQLQAKLDELQRRFDERAAALGRTRKSLLRGNPTARSERYTEVLERLKKRLDTHTHR